MKNILAIKPNAQGRGISTILASSIFNLLPNISRLTLYVLYTNKKAINIYESFGFKKYKDFWIESSYEYFTNENKKLQNVVSTFEEITTLT